MNKLVEQIVNEIKLQLFSEDNTDKGNLIAVYPGRFQPMGLHHYESYKWLAKQFGEKNTYIATSDKMDPQKSPFNFEEKKKIMLKHGISERQIVKITNPYSPLQFFDVAGLDPKSTTIVYMVGEKDMGRLRGFRKLMKFNKTTYVPAKDLEEPYTYYVYAPHISYSIPSFGEMSGTTIRKALSDRNAKLSELKSRFKSIMGWFDASIFNLVIHKLNTNRGDLKEDLNDWFRVLLNMSQEQVQLFFDIAKKEYGDTKDLLPIVQKYVKTRNLTDREKYLFQKQLKDTMKIMGLGAIAAIPIPGTMLLIPAIIQMAKKFNINLLPEADEPEKESLPIVKREFWNKVFEEVLKEDTVMCEECGEHMKQIQYRHLKYKHNMTLDEYVKKHPNSKLVSESAKNYGDKNPMNIPGVRDKQKESLNTPEMKKLFAEKSKNRPVLEETRLKCSINNSMKDPENKKKVSARLKETYKNNEELIQTRREKFTEIRNSESYKKRMIELGYWRNEEDIPKYEKYVSTVRTLTESSYKDYFYEIPNAKQRSRDNHLDHKISIHFGFKHNIDPKIIAHYCNLEVIPRTLNESKFTKNSITPLELRELIISSNNKIDTRQLLVCGGAAGHMTHPFEDTGLTFGDMKEMFRLGLSGDITTKSAPTEKLDGQNLFASFRKGKLYAARNKSDIKNGGMDYESIQTKFSGRGSIEEAFTFAFADLEKAIQSLNPKQQEKIFKGGKAWMNLEIMYPKSENIINYDGAYIVFHGVSLYNDSGEKVEDYPEYARMLAGMIKQVNAHSQNTFKITQPKAITVAKNAKFDERLQYFIGKLESLQKKMNCVDSDTIGVWHQRWWEKYIKKGTKDAGLNVDPQTLESLTKRWAFGDKSFVLNSKNITDPKLLDWAKGVDKIKVAEQVKKNVLPFELLVLEFGAEVLKNVSTVMSVNPTKTTNKIKADVEKAITTLSNSSKLEDIQVLKTQLKRIQGAGGIDAIVPLEGIVFTFNGKTYKLTGAFAPINQLLNYFRFKT